MYTVSVTVYCAAIEMYASIFLHGNFVQMYGPNVIGGLAQCRFESPAYADLLFLLCSMCVL